MRARLLSLLVAAAMSAGPAFALRAPRIPDLRQLLLAGGGGKGKRKHRMSGTGGRSRGNRPGCYMPHQGRQERLRRLIGGFHTGHKYGITKARLIARIDEAAARGGRVQEIAQEAFA